MTNPLVSIIIPTYNRAEFLNKKIQNILNQTYKNIEIIIVNDCSTDNTIEVVKSYIEKGHNIKLFSNEINKKLPASINIGLKYIQGDYVTWCADDDIHDEKAIEVMLHFLISNTKTDIVFTDYNMIDEDDRIFDYVRLSNEGDLAKNNCVGWNTLYKKEVPFKLNGFNEGLFLVEDYDFWLRASKYFKISHIKGSFASQKMHKNSLTAVYNDKINNYLHYIAIEKNIKNLSWISGERKIRMFYTLFKFRFKRKEFLFAIKHLIYLKINILIYTLPYIFRRIFKVKRNFEYLN